MSSFFSLLFGDTASLIFNVLIIIAGVALASRLASTNKEMCEHLRNVRRMFSTTRKQFNTNSEGLTVVTSETEGFSTKDINIDKTNYEGLCAKANSLIQLVPIFPSVGILGTVVGLMLQVTANGIEQMTGAIATALSSTFFALIVTILLKVYIALNLSRTMNEIEIFYRDNDRYQQEQAESFRNSTEG